jgi:protein involved in temperature-dependent protein secretion
VIVKAAPQRSEQLARPSVPSKATDVGARIKQARVFLDQGAYSEALNELNNAAKMDPVNRQVQDDINTTKRACHAERTLGRSDLTCQ